MNDPQDIARLLATGRFRLGWEKDTQGDVETFLRANLPGGVSIEREKRLGRGDIPDFLLAGSIVVEVKISRAPKRGLMRQLARYAGHDEVAAQILLSNTTLVLPASIGGKPAFFVSLGRAWM